MGKSSRRPRRQRAERTNAPVPFVSRPFEGMPGESEWVAMREIVPAATATVRFAKGQAPEGVDDGAEVTLATVLPLAWPGLHRDSGEILVGIQSGNGNGDTSRDIAQAILLAAEATPGSPVESLPPATVETTRLQDLLDLSTPIEVTLHDGFDFWVAEAELDEEGAASLERANETVIPTARIEAAPSCYWCRIGERTYVRWVLPYDEDTATNALSRLHAAGESSLGEGRLLGCFRSSGLLIPVWEVDAAKQAADFEADVADMHQRIEQAAANTEPLNAQERGAKAGLTNRQVTLR